MDLHTIKIALTNPDFQQRLKAITALKEYEADVAIPLLTSRLGDPEFLVRSFVAMGLGQKQGADSFAALLEMVKLDRDTNVRAEAANSLSLYGDVSVPHLVAAFCQNDNWLVRRSILAAIADMDCPDSLYDISLEAIHDNDITVQQAGIDALGLLVHTSQHQKALLTLTEQSQSESPLIRVRVVYALKRFTEPEAKDCLLQLRQDSDHRVVGAVLEELP